MDSQIFSKKDVFLSYSAADKQWAEDACSAIEARQHSCWIAPRDIVPGIFSSAANSSPQVRREIERGIGKGLILLPFRVEDVKPSGALEYALSNTHWLDGFKSPRQRQLDLLADAVSRLIEGTSSGAFPAAHPQAKSRLNRTFWWVAASAVAAVVFAALIVLIAVSNPSNPEMTKKEGEEAKTETADDSEGGPQVFPRGGLWKFEMKGQSGGASEVLTGHFRIGDKMKDRRLFFQKEKPSSHKFEKPVGSAVREGNGIQVDFAALRGADQETNFQKVKGKAKLTMDSIGVWSGVLIDAEQRKWDLRCTRITD